LDALGRDPATRAVLIYVESLRNALKFLSAARVVADLKPVVLLKGGRSPAGARAAFSHTRALAGADAVYSAAMRRSGVLQVDTLDDLLAAGFVFARAGRRRPMISSSSPAAAVQGCWRPTPWSAQERGSRPCRRTLRPHCDRCGQQFRGHPGRRPARASDLLIALGRLAADIPEIAELDLNPVLCDAAGVIVVDARIAIRPLAVPAMAP
jgi:hypothetical protein